MAISAPFMEKLEVLLSGNLVDVELEPADYQVAFDKAKQTWKQKGNSNLHHGYVVLEMIAHQNSYQLPIEVTDVISVVRRRGAGSLATIDDPFAMAGFQYFFNYNGNVNGSFLIYELTSQVLENRRTLRADEPFFKFSRRDKTLFLNNPPKTDQLYYIEVYKELDDIEYEENLWILEWTLAELKHILGRAYRKFGNSLSSPTGESALDGEALVQESREDKERLLEEIDNFTDGDPDGLGIYIG